MSSESESWYAPPKSWKPTLGAIILSVVIFFTLLIFILQVRGDQQRQVCDTVNGLRSDMVFILKQARDTARHTEGLSREGEAWYKQAIHRLETRQCESK